MSEKNKALTSPELRDALAEMHKHKRRASFLDWVANATKCSRSGSGGLTRRGALRNATGPVRNGPARHTARANKIQKGPEK